MPVIHYDKLVRDNIPDIILAQGKIPVVSVLSGPNYKEHLRGKLLEETEEYLESEAPEELADILEVLFALADEQGVTPEELENIRLKKREERGGFTKRLLLIDVEQPD